jgi:hypothetical protein
LRSSTRIETILGEMHTTASTRPPRQREVAVKRLAMAMALTCAFTLIWDLQVAKAQDMGTGGFPRVGATAILAEVSAGGLDAQQEEAFQRKQKRQLAVGWTLMGAGTALAVSAVWLSRSGGDPSVGLKRSLAVVIPGVAMVVAGGGVLIKRRVEKNEHDSPTQLRLTPTSISVERRF